MSLTKQIIFSLLVVVLAVGGWYGFTHRQTVLGAARVETAAPAGGRGPGAAGQGGPRGGARAPTAVTVPVAMETIGDAFRAVGSVAALREVTLYPQVTGIVREVGFKAGDRVAKGAVLLRIEDSDQQVAAQAAKVTLDDATAALGRAQTLSKSQNIAQVALQNAQSAASKAEIALKSAQLEIAKRTIVAPFDGVVGLTTLEVGDLVTTSTVVASLDDVSKMTVAFSAPERFVEILKIGYEVSAKANALPGTDIKGKVSAIDSRVDPASRTFRVEATLDTNITDLKPGMAVTVAVTTAGTAQATVPSLAVQWDRKGSYVWKVADGVVHRTPVDIASRRSGSVVVVGELAPGDPVVVEGLQRMRDGIQVTMVPSGGAAPGRAAGAPAERRAAGPQSAAAGE